MMVHATVRAGRYGMFIVLPIALFCACPEAGPPAVAPPTSTYPTPSSTPPTPSSTPPTPSSTAPTTSPPSAMLETTCGDGSKLKLGRGCSSDADCGFFEERGCCGHRPAIGVRASDAKRADPQCPRSDCSHMGCPSGGLLAEDGNATFNREEIAVRCAQGTCTTRVATAGCCEDGLTWSGCCSTPSNPKSHQCGDPAPCAVACIRQKSCK